jgi:hypothetical protein
MDTAMTSELISEPAGPRFGPYILTAVLGRGGMGVVYHVARGMDPVTVRGKVARSFARHTGFRPAACQWAVDELAAVLGLDSAGARPAG